MNKISRNDPCWCGSGKKYKVCHLSSDIKLTSFEEQGYQVPGRNLIRTKNEIELLKKSAAITKEALVRVEEMMIAGTKTIDIDKFIYDFTISKGGRPATLGYNGFKHSCCVSVNNVICHEIPSERELQNGDIVNVDLTTDLNGYFSDASRMFLIGEVDSKNKKLVDCAKECLERGVKAVKPFEPIENIAEAIEPFANEKGYSVVKDLGGHGIGLKFHDDPHVNHFITGGKTMIMVPGMVFTIEPMINELGYATKTLDDGWTVVTVDDGMSAQWEHTVLVTKDGAEILV